MSFIVLPEINHGRDKCKPGYFTWFMNPMTSAKRRLEMFSEDLVWFCFNCVCWEEL